MASTSRPVMTDAERQVMDLVRRGKTPREIAEARSVSINAIHSMFKRMREKGVEGVPGGQNGATRSRSRSSNGSGSRRSRSSGSTSRRSRPRATAPATPPVDEAVGVPAAASALNANLARLRALQEEDGAERARLQDEAAKIDARIERRDEEIATVARSLDALGADRS